MPPVEVVTKEAKGVVMVLGQLPTELAQLGHRLLLVSWGGCPTSGSWTRSSHPGFQKVNHGGAENYRMPHYNYKVT